MPEEKATNNNLSQQHQQQMLKLVTQSFYRELINYGVEAADIVTVTTNLLDQIYNTSRNIGINSDSIPREKNYYNNLFRIAQVTDHWTNDQELIYEKVSLRPLKETCVPTIAKWLRQTALEKSFIRYFPSNEEELTRYLFETPTHFYLGIYYHDFGLIGIIGADNIDPISKKLEMKKFIGETTKRGLGIGKMATFLFLYYAFVILKFNKVFIHSMDTNIRNININSKFGFEVEGVFFEDTFLDGEYNDVVQMGLLKATWIAIFNQMNER